MANIKARSMGDRMSLAVRMANNTIHTPANKTTDVSIGGGDGSEFIIDLLEQDCPGMITSSIISLPN
jgi:hypothetical protein